MVADDIDPFRALIENSADGLLVHADMQPLYANPAFLQLVGLTSFEELVVIGVEGILAPHERSRVRQTHRARMQDVQATTVMDVDLLHRTGSVIAVESRVSLCQFQGRRCVSISLSDASYRQRIEHQLSLQTRRFLQAEEVAQLGHFRWNRESDTVDLSPNAGRLMGDRHTVSSLGLDDFVDCFDPARRDEIRQALTDLHKAADGFSLEPVGTRDGRRYLRVAGHAERSSSGALEGKSGFLLDITEAQRQREALALLARASHGSEDPVAVAARALSASLGYRRALVCRLSDDQVTADTLACWDTDRYAAGAAFTVAGTPCEAIVDTADFLWIPDGATERFPDAPMLKAWNARAYVGAPIHDVAGKVIGHLAACHDQPDRGIGNRDLVLFIAEWISLELARRSAVQATAANQRMLESIVNTIPAIVHLKNREGRYLFVNDGFTRELDVAKEDALGRTPHELIDLGLTQASHAGVARFDALDEQVWQNNEALPFRRTDYVEPSGLERHWLMAKRRIDDGPGNRPALLTVSLNIGEQIQVEQALREREMQLRGIMDNLPGAALRARVQPDGHRRFLFVSDGVRQLFGFAREALEDSWSEALTRAISATEGDRIRTESARAYAAGQPYSTIISARTVDGGHKWLLHRSHVVASDGDGWIVDSILLDATGQIRAERLLSERDRQIKTLIDNLPGAAFRYRVGRDGSRKLLFMSSGFRELYGWDESEHDNDAARLTQLIMNDDERERLRQESNVAFAAGQSYTGLYPIRSKDGQNKWAMLRARPVEEDAAGWLIDGIAIDVTEQVRAEQALQERERQLAALLANLPGAAWRSRIYCDNRREQLFISEGILELTGWRPQEFVMRDCREEVFGQGNFARITEESLAAYSAAKPYFGIHPIRCKDGQEKWVALRAHAVAEESDAWLVDGIIIDVTEQIRAQKLLQERDRRLHDLQAELLQVSRVSAMGTLSSAIAHEISQPLAAVGNYLAATDQVLKQSDIPLPENVRQYLEKARQQSGRAGAVVASLRRFFERGELAVSEEDLNSAVEEAASLALLDQASRRISTRFEFAADLEKVSFDRLQIQQVIVNLIRNAVQILSEAEEPMLTVTTRRDDDGDSVVVEVADNGPGLPAEVADRIFDRFATTRPTGMGMGLAICKSVLKAHDSDLEFRTDPGRGTAFWFRLSLRREITVRQQA